MKHKKNLMITSSDDPMAQYECEHCNNTTLVASISQTPYCYHCGEQLADGNEIKQVSITANDEAQANYIACESCQDTFTVYNSKMGTDDVALAGYCVICGNDTLVSNEEEDDMEEDVETPETPVTSTEQEENLEEVENDAKQSLEASVAKLNASELQWSIVDSTEGENSTLLASSGETGLPVIVFNKKNAPEGMKPLFASTGFVDAFTNVAKTSSLGEAVKTFGGNFFKSQEILASIDLEDMAFAKVEATVVPKLIDCCQTAVEGGVKGIFPDVSAGIQSNLVNELIASGIPRDRAEHAVTNSFALHGSTLFGTIIAKACELFNKSEEQLNETRELVASAEGPGFVPYDKEQVAVRNALDKPNMLLSTSTNWTAASNVDSISTDSVKALQRQIF